MLAQHNRYSLEILINSFVNEHIRNDLLNTKDFKGNTLIHLAAKYNVESLIFLINEFPGQVMKMLEVKNNIGETALRFAACNTTSIKLINDFLGVEIYGAERGISIPGIPDALSYYYQDQVSLLLKLRLEDAKPGILKSIDVLDEIYVLIDGNEDDLSAKLSSFILNSEKNTMLMPLNIGGKHLVGIAAEKYNGKVILHYMDSELNSPPASLFMKIGAMLESYGYSMEFRAAKVEEQNYSNCGPEVIENLTAFASGKTRTSQEKAISKHSTLFEKHLLKNSNDNNNTHESIIKSTPVISESATILGNTLFYEISRVSGIKKSIELKIANSYILLDDKTEAQLIYYYNTGELLNYTRIMLEGSSVEIQERYKFFIASEKFEVSMPGIFITDGKLQAQILYYLRTGEAFSSARSALENGTVRVTSLSSTTSEEEVENIVPLRSLARIKSEDSYTDSGENLDFSEELFTNESTGGLLKSWLNILINLSPTTLLESL